MERGEEEGGVRGAYIRKNLRALRSMIDCSRVPYFTYLSSRVSPFFERRTEKSPQRTDDYDLPYLT